MDSIHHCFSRDRIYRRPRFKNEVNTIRLGPVRKGERLLLVYLSGESEGGERM